jgi:hypothetical protein
MVTGAGILPRHFAESATVCIIEYGLADDE